MTPLGPVSPGHDRQPLSRRVRVCRAWLAVVLAIGGLAVQPVAADAERPARVDRVVKHLLDRESETTPLKVIIQVRPGAKRRGLLRLLEAQGRG